MTLMNMNRNGRDCFSPSPPPVTASASGGSYSVADRAKLFGAVVSTSSRSAQNSNSPPSAFAQNSSPHRKSSPISLGSSRSRPAISCPAPASSPHGQGRNNQNNQITSRGGDSGNHTNTNWIGTNQSPRTSSRPPQAPAPISAAAPRGRTPTPRGRFNTNANASGEGQRQSNSHQLLFTKKGGEKSSIAAVPASSSSTLSSPRSVAVDVANVPAAFIISPPRAEARDEEAEAGAEARAEQSEPTPPAPEAIIVVTEQELDAALGELNDLSNDVADMRQRYATYRAEQKELIAQRRHELQLLALSVEQLQTQHHNTRTAAAAQRGHRGAGQWTTSRPAGVW
jgi:hypothetical protein